MKSFVFISFLFILSFSIVSGQSISFKEKLFAPALHDTITYTVYIPQDWEGWDPQELHPAVYAINYGMLNGDYLAAQVAYFRKARYALPNSLIIVIDASMARMGYQYETGALTDEGKQFVSFIKGQLIPLITQKYHTSGFRTYIGHSFASSFGANLFLNEPGLFNGFILLAPEKIGPEQPPFHLSVQAHDYYNQHYTFFYAAVGQGDLQRRKDFAMEMGRESAGLDKDHFFFQYDSIERADHTNILTLSIEFAFKNLYRFYTPYNGLNEPDALTDLKQVSGAIRKYYDLEMEKTFTFYNPFVQEAVDYKDTTALKAILAYFTGPRLKGWNLKQFGEFCLKLNLNQQASIYFEEAIDKINNQELNQPIGPPNLMVCYDHMAFDIYPGQPTKAWGYLMQSLRVTESRNIYLADDGTALLNLGKYAAQSGFKLREGLQYLSRYRAGHYKSNDMAAYYMARIYQQLNQSSEVRRYLQLALTENPGNKSAIDMSKEINLH